jgi:hypothetical protein
MLPFPLKQFLGNDTNMSLTERELFLLLEKIAYLCLSKFEHARPNATQILQCFDGSRTFNSDFLMIAPLSKWYNNPDFSMGTPDNNPISQDTILEDTTVTEPTSQTPIKIQTDICDMVCDQITALEIADNKQSLNQYSNNISDRREPSNTLPDNSAYVMNSTPQNSWTEWVRNNWKLECLVGLVIVTVIILVFILKPDKGKRRE